jgi:hypothetical protein
MTPEQESFDALRRLLKLKRYEQPPPGYFNSFSREVVAQIRAGEKAVQKQTLEGLFWEAPWLQRLLDSFQARPAFAAGFGSAICALAIGIVAYSQSLQYKQMPPMPGVEAIAKVIPTSAAAPDLGLQNLGDGSLATLSTNSSLSPSMQPSASLFGIQIEPQRASYFPGSRN